MHYCFYYFRFFLFRINLFTFSNSNSMLKSTPKGDNPIFHRQIIIKTICMVHKCSFLRNCYLINIFLIGTVYNGGPLNFFMTYNCENTFFVYITYLINIYFFAESKSLAFKKFWYWIHSGPRPYPDLNILAKV